MTSANTSSLTSPMTRPPIRSEAAPTPRFRIIDGYQNRLLGKHKRTLLDELPRTVVELGPGVGANVGYYRPGTQGDSGGAQRAHAREAKGAEP